jgi:RNA polymerase sigma factor (sigma-70 family)
VETPSFTSKREARAYVEAAAVERSSLPFHGILDADGLEDLRLYLEHALRTHPLLRLLAGRAAEEAWAPFAPPAELREAARGAGDDDEADEAPPPVAREKKERPIPELPGGLTLRDPEQYKTAKTVIEQIARELAGGNKDKRKELVAEGWRIAVEVSPSFDPTKGKYRWFLWSRVRAGLVNYVRKASNRREIPASSKWADDAKEGSIQGHSAQDKLHRATDAAAASYALGWHGEPEEDPETKLTRERERADLHRALEALTEDERSVIVAVHWQDMTLKAFAATRKLSESKAGRLNQEALEKLAAKLRETSKVVPLFRARRPEPVE